MTAKWSFNIVVLLFSFQCPASPNGAIAKDFVAAHNHYRAKVGTPPLAWSDKLASSAQQWATTLIERNMFTHSKDQYGQNLFEISGGHATPSSVVASWMSEEGNYNHQTNSCRARCGHYTQVIWRGTKLVGCGVGRNAQREVWVCDYDPPGNILGEKPY